MSSNNDSDKSKKSKVTERILHDDISVGVNEKVQIDGEQVVIGKGDLQAGDASMSGVGEVKHQDDTVIEANQAELNLKANQATVSSSSEESSDKNAVSEKDMSLKANASIGLSASATLSDATSSSKGTVSPSVEDNDTLSAKGHVFPKPNIATHSSLNDSASTIDCIGYAPYIKALSKFICHKDTQTPLVVGVFGEWGAGKTSFMSQLKEEVNRKNKDKNKQVWFNAWKYDNQNDLWAALLQAITSQVENNTNKFMIVFRRFCRLASWKFFINLTFITLVVYILWPSGGAEVVPKDNELVNTIKSDTMLGVVLSIFPPGVTIFLFYWIGVFKPVIEFVKKMKNPLGLDVQELVRGKNLPDKVEGIRTFEKDLKIRLSDYLDGDGRLIIYIDDLDRCSPEHVVEIIEAVNLFLETERCVFILGMDHKLISSAIELKYKELSILFKDMYNDKESPSEEERGYGEFFLKKIVQVPITIPSMSDAEIQRYMNSLMEGQTMDYIATLPATSPEEGEEVEIIEDENISISYSSKDVIKTLLPYMKPNPRAIKRFYNMLGFIHFFHIANKDKLKEINDIALTIWFFLLYYFSNEINKIENKGSVTWDEIVAGCDGQCLDIKAFFISYTTKKEHMEIMNALSGEVDEYIQVTRILEM